LVVVIITDPPLQGAMSPGSSRFRNLKPSPAAGSAHQVATQLGDNPQSMARDKYMCGKASVALDRHPRHRRSRVLRTSKSCAPVRRFSLFSSIDIGLVSSAWINTGPPTVSVQCKVTKKNHICPFDRPLRYLPKRRVDVQVSVASCQTDGMSAFHRFFSTGRG
jgi:hypothetical protein